jgi:hypothetical protein
VLVDSAADTSAAAAAWAASHAADAAAAVPVSSYKGVEYLPAEKRWQAYVLDKAISEVRRGGGTCGHTWTHSCRV